MKKLLVLLLAVMLLGCLAACSEKQPEHIHSYTMIVTQPTCTADGYTTYSCACGHSYKDNVIVAKGHSYQLTVVEPTCTKDGYTAYTCACGYSYKDDTVVAPGHNYLGEKN